MADGTLRPIGTTQIKSISSRDEVSAHWLCHAHASRAKASGKHSVVTIATTLGHANISVTGRYMHTVPNTSSSIGHND